MAGAADPVVARLRGGGANMPALVYPDLDGEEAADPGPTAAPRHEVATAVAAVRTPRADRHPAPSRHESDQRLAAWAAEWAAPTGKTGAGPVDTSARTSEASHAKSRTEANAAIEPSAPHAPTPLDPTVRVLSGPNHGRAVPFSKDELSVGRVGVQVAVVRKVGTGFRLVPVEGAQPPRINGMPVAPEGTALHPGDTFEVPGEFPASLVDLRLMWERVIMA